MEGMDLGTITPLFVIVSKTVGELLQPNGLERPANNRSMGTGLSGLVCRNPKIKKANPAPSGGWPF